MFTLGRWIASSLAALSLIATCGTFAFAEDIVKESDSNEVKIQKYSDYIKHHKGYAGFEPHNELRHLLSANDLEKSMRECDIILANEPMNDYILSILSDWTLPNNPTAAVDKLTAKAEAYPQFPALRAACLLKAAQICAVGDKENARRLYDKVIATAKNAEAAQYGQLAFIALQMEGAGTMGDGTSRTTTITIQSSQSFSNAAEAQSNLNSYISAMVPQPQPPQPLPPLPPVVQGMIEWPNQFSKANSDPWLISNHDHISKMNPSLLVINFANGVQPAQVVSKVNSLIACVRESSRYHGYADPSAPPFLDYKVLKWVDAADSYTQKLGIDGNSSKFPWRAKDAPGSSFAYPNLFLPQFTSLYNVRNPSNPSQLMSLAQMVDTGMVHEVWFVCYQGSHGAPFECVELKQQYDENMRAIPGSFVQAGNGGDPAQPQIGRSLRLLFINIERGPGCAMESLGHSIERMGSGDSLPYLTPYFKDYAGFNLKQKYGMPFDELGGRDGNELNYPDRHTLSFKYKGKKMSFSPYIPVGNCVHFTINGRHDYDLDNDQPVLTTIEHYRMHDAMGRADAQTLFTPAVYAKYREFAGDCMGPWLVYWRQNMPGLNNRSFDDYEKPMKNWWPFLFY